ncbi:MAG: DNA polymerase III subunit alpha [Bacteroidetes bacterium]|nr:DNA polymerase III subunit alpha [Bacteroidota bacterium]
MYLNCHTYFSFKFGTMSPEQLLQEAQRKDISRLALTDINNTSGILDFFRKAGEYNIKPVAGIDFRNGSRQQFIGIAKNPDGFRELNRFLSVHLKEKKDFHNRAPQFDHAFIIYPFHNAHRDLRENEFIGIKFSDLNKLVFSDIKYLRNKVVVLQPVTFLERDYREVQGRTITFTHQHIHHAHRLLRAIDHNTLLSKLEEGEVADKNEIMLPEKNLRNLFADYSFAVENTRRILDACSIDFGFAENKNKKFFYGGMAEDREKLLAECERGMQYRYQNPDEKVMQRFKKEIDVITQMNFTAYFLINWDIVKYARHRNFFYVGRGSGANSMVAYLLRITDVDPIDLDLYFERFINPSRENPPDFDIDFSSSERPDIIRYIFDTHGEDHTALLATYSTLQENSVVRELGKVYGLPKNEIDTFLSDRLAGATPDTITKKISAYGEFLKDFPGHLSIHAGGILISEKPIHSYTATTLPPKDFPLTQFSMLEAEDVGLYKFDILAQRGLGKIKDAVEIIKQNRRVNIDIHEVKRFKEDDAVRENLGTANLMGCFYVESPAMRMLLKKLHAKTYLDLVAASSIIRPGVAQSGMMREYILRFHDPKRRTYPNQLMEELLRETFGVMVYQEDVIKVAHHFAKLSLAESDKLRRGMGGKYRGRQEFWDVKEKFFSNCREQGYDEKIISDTWMQMESFGGYAFSKGHSASYAVESYQCMFLKTHYPLEFMVAVINNGGGFYATEFYVHEARMFGGKIHAPDINKSTYMTSIEGSDIYIGLNLIAELERHTADVILEERQHNGDFSSLEDFMKRVSIAVEQLRILIRVGAFRFDRKPGTARTKKQLLWDIHSIIGAGKKTEARKELFEVSHTHYRLPELHHGKFDDAFDETEILGFPLSSPFELLLSSEGSFCKGESGLRAADLKNHCGKIISIAGYSVTRKRTRTKKGEEMSFGTFLDRDGQWIDTTHFPGVLKQYPFRGKGCYLITGKVVEEFGFYSLDVAAMERLDSRMRYEEEKKQVSEEQKV